MKIKVNGVEIETENGEVTIDKNGKVTVRPTTYTPTYPWWTVPYLPTRPWWEPNYTIPSGVITTYPVAASAAIPNGQWSFTNTE